eukprot:scaffold10108_cov117-Isochrysis_galbana.AAC.3
MVEEVGATVVRLVEVERDVKNGLSRLSNSNQGADRLASYAAQVEDFFAEYTFAYAYNGLLSVGCDLVNLFHAVALQPGEKVVGTPRFHS